MSRAKDALRSADFRSLLAARYVSQFADGMFQAYIFALISHQCEQRRKMLTPMLLQIREKTLKIGVAKREADAQDLVSKQNCR